MRNQSKKGALRRAGYSLVEVMVAAGIIATGVAAAVSLSAATTSQEEAGHNIARALAVAENAARLFRLGLTGDEVKTILPKDPVVYSMTIVEDTPTVTGLGTMQRATITIEYDVSPVLQVWDEGEWATGPGGSDSRRSFTIEALRPTVRAGYN